MFILKLFLLIEMIVGLKLYDCPQTLKDLGDNHGGLTSWYLVYISERQVCRQVLTRLVQFRQAWNTPAAVHGLRNKYTTKFRFWQPKKAIRNFCQNEFTDNLVRLVHMIQLV